MAPAARKFAEFALGLRYEDIPEDVRQAAKLHLLDTLGCGIAAVAVGVAGEGKAVMLELGGEGPSTVIGHDAGMSAANAAFANAMTCHGLDFDDTHSDSISHVSTVVCPASIAVAEAVGASGTELLTAIVVGNEVVTRVGMAAPSQFHARGFHPTAICGIFGAVAACARLQGLDAETTTRALGIAGSFASGIFAYLAEGTRRSRCTRPGRHGAVLATRLAAHGAVGPGSVLEGKFGLYHAFVGAEPGSIDIAAQCDDLGSRWETPRIAYKPYPACHYMHGALGAAREAVAGRTFSADEIDEILVTVHPAGVPLVLEPEEAKKTPRSEYEGKFSLQYSAASLLVRGHVGVVDYLEDAIGEQRVLDVAQKVRYEAKDYETYPQAFPGGARITLADGTVLEADLAYQKGGPENPLTADEVKAKYRGNALLGLAAADADAIEQACMAIESVTDVTAAFAPLANATAREHVAA
ncbi:MAG: MmgE/PrpD family protein [Thermoleophilia bacterium]